MVGAHTSHILRTSCDHQFVAHRQFFVNCARHPYRLLGPLNPRPQNVKDLQEAEPSLSTPDDIASLVPLGADRVCGDLTQLGRATGANSVPCSLPLYYTTAGFSLHVLMVIYDSSIHQKLSCITETAFLKCLQRPGFCRYLIFAASQMPKLMRKDCHLVILRAKLFR